MEENYLEEYLWLRPMLEKRFRAGELRAVMMMETTEEGSDERKAYLEKVVGYLK